MTTPKSPLRYNLTLPGLILTGLILLVLGLTGCATAPMTAGQQQKLAEDIYAEGREALQAQDYTLAGSHFKSLEIYYPDSPYNHQAQMELAYAYFKSADYSSTIATTDRLIRNYPDNDNHDYPRYLKALASFEQTVLLIEADNDRDATLLTAQTTLRYFEELLTHFPNSKYQQDADKRVAYLQEQLAQYEITRARNLIEQGNHASAIIHARNVVENYPHTRSAADALAIVDMGYEILAIGSPEAADDMTPPLPASIPTAISDAVPLVTAALHSNDANAAEPTAVMASADASHLTGTHTTTWILQQPANHYTIQLVSTLKKDALQRFISRNKLDDRVAYYRKQISGKIWHALIYGVYANGAEARAALAELPEALRNSKPWIQRIKAIHQAMDNFTHNN